LQVEDPQKANSPGHAVSFGPAGALARPGVSRTVSRTSCLEIFSPLEEALCSIRSLML